MGFLSQARVSIFTMKTLFTTYSTISTYVVNTLDLVLLNIIQTHRNLISKTRLPENGKRWIRTYEFKKYATLVAWITKTQHMRPYYILLLQRVEKLVKACSFTWAFAYMKETLRLTVRALALTPERVTINPKIRVARDYYGLPTIIPQPIRIIMRNFIDGEMKFQVERRVIIASLTVITVFRAFKTKVEAKLDTITDKFSGFSVVLPQYEVRAAVRNLLKHGNSKVTIGNFKPVVSQKAGPNVPFSTWGASIDALAFVDYPANLLSLLRWMYIQRSYKYIAWLVSLLVMFGPIYWIARSLGRMWIAFQGFYSADDEYEFVWSLHLGKLSVVYNQAGKARVVAATNWWMQSALVGLHDSIFNLLRTIPQDGTFDQEACFNKLLSRSDSFSQEFGNKLSGFDLSAATDRLPIDLQVQILNELGLPGELWREILSIPWVYHRGINDTQYVWYRVGQPMGAYSSWAMLALTHHVIVRIAAARANVNASTCNYAILGDDVVINNDATADVYLNIMSLLGLDISMGKSVVSYKLTEFAKRLAGPGVEVTPLGAGLIVSALRSHYMVPALCATAISNLCYSPNEVLDLLRNIPGGLYNKRLIQEICLNSVWQSFLNNTWFKEISLLNVKTLNRYSNFFAADALNFPHKLVGALSAGLMREIEVQKENAHEAMTNFLLEALSLLASRTWPLRLLELLMKPFNPGFWMYLRDSLDLPLRLDERFEEILAKKREIGVENVLEQIFYLQSIEGRLSVMDIAKMKPQKAKIAMRFFKELQRRMSM
uniref:RNA-dependent RNA polymerase n=1 Tax=Rhizoctonia cerealis duamitovirus TaxID=3068666 RepID=A0AA51BSB5_9VIRU|nr:MAG: RNA-dependent RNA polymerase [Rhizoctonia cerealis duamitovirus]